MELRKKNGTKKKKMEIKNRNWIGSDFLVVTPVNYWTVCEQINNYDKNSSQ